MPFAAMTCGNHELYIDSTVENLVQVSIASCLYDESQTLCRIHPFMQFTDRLTFSSTKCH
jgi:hypothetical protein